MPPSGFSRTAVKGAVTYIRQCFADLIREAEDGKHVNLLAGVEFEIAQIDRALVSSGTSDSPFKTAGVIGSLHFIKSCYEDLREGLLAIATSTETEVSGEDSDGGEVKESAVIERVLARISKEMERIHIDDAGCLVERTL